MDDRLSAQSVMANAEDVAKWCAATADEVEGIANYAKGRPWSPGEQERMAVLFVETLRRVSQQNSLWTTLAFHWFASPRVWIRAFLWGRLRGKR